MTAANRREAVRNDLVWYLTAFKEIRYYVWSLTLCRIGHKPKLRLLETELMPTAAELRCTRCKKTLDFQVSTNTE